MIVTGCTIDYLRFTQMWLAAVGRIGKIPTKHVVLMLIGSPAERAFLSQQLKPQRGRATLIELDPTASEFNFLRMVTDEKKNRFANFWFADYARAWIGKQLGRYVWMDSDILARGSIREFLDPSVTDVLSLAQEHGLHKKRLYLQSYLDAHGDYPVVRLDDRGSPITYNCGVITVDRDYSSLWRKTFKQVIAMRTAPAYRRLLKMMDLGQLVWNHIAWLRGAAVMNGCMNEHIERATDDSVLVHYAGRGKPRMLPDFIAAGLLHSLEPRA